MKRILVVDDNMASLKQIGAQLSGSYQVSLSKSGAQALKICDETHPDLILLDVEMPEMDGFEVSSILRADPALSRIPVIFLTGNHDINTEIRALESGAVDFITKPAERSILLHRLELHLQLTDYQTNLENTVKELENSIVVSFADLIECKNDNTGGHVLRTGKYVEILGRELVRRGIWGAEFTDLDVDLMARAAPFHDIGKIGVSDVILLKPGPLSDDEYDEVKKHTVIGARVLSNIYERTPTQQYLKYAAMVAEGHHERYDGKGYPYGLKGDDIPFCSRVMAVANVYDACLTERVYRPAITPNEAYEVIMSGSGTKFDPVITVVFADMYPSFPVMDMNHPHIIGSWNSNLAAP
ncbi:MAG: response regulator [Synergistaceae bacterium]|jgi:putative two-component system response regulator|nr:response regulator [Synergistaceae bacterium]